VDSEYSRAKNIMVRHTNIPECPGYFVHSNCKRRARLYCITHLLALIPKEKLEPKPLGLPPRKSGEDYVRPALADQPYIEEVY
jgi:hypothetical protein